MLTIGREREKRHAEGFITKPADVLLIHRVIDAVHDVVEGSIPPHVAIPVLTHAFVMGGTGVWEQTGSWIRKLTSEHSEFGSVWEAMAEHSSARIRFRVAAFLDDMPDPIRGHVLSRLINDPSARVRAKVAGDCSVSPRTSDQALLQARHACEVDPLVVESLDYALSAIAKTKV